MHDTTTKNQLTDFQADNAALFSATQSDLDQKFTDLTASTTHQSTQLDTKIAEFRAKNDENCDKLISQSTQHDENSQKRVKELTETMEKKMSDAADDANNKFEAQKSQLEEAKTILAT